MLYSMLILFVTLSRARTRFGLIWDSFVVEFSVFEALLVNSVCMLAFESLLGIFWINFVVQNDALGFIVDHIGLTSVLIWTPKVDKIVNNCTKVQIK